MKNGAWEMTKEQEVLKKLVGTIVSTGGLIRYEEGSFGCAGDEDWLDLADTVLLAQRVLRESQILVEIPIAFWKEIHPRERLQIESP